MRLTSLFLRNFRNYEEVRLGFGPGVNYIYGDNGQGKTNLLEAIFLLITGRSFRTRHLAELIRFGEESFYIEGRFEKNGVEQVLKMQMFEGKRTVLHNHTPLSKLSSLFGLLHGTLLTPEDHQLIVGNPKMRRLFLDLQISQTHPLYLHHLSRYQRAMKQRNTLLRQKRREGIEVWEEQMGESATYLVKLREETIQELDFPHTLTYLPSCRSNLAEKLAQGRERDFILGITSAGPHKDDLSILMKERSARSFASEGQKRMMVAQLRFAEWKRLYQHIEEKPLLCIDDAGLSFDLKKEEALLASLAQFGQVFVTSARFNSTLSQEASLFEIYGSGKARTPSLR